MNIIINYKTITNQTTHSFGRLKKCPRTFVQVCTMSLRSKMPYGTTSREWNSLSCSLGLKITCKMQWQTNKLNRPILPPKLPWQPMTIHINSDLSQEEIYFRGPNATYRKTSNISHILVGNKIVDNSDVVGASPVGAAPTTSSFST